MKIVRFEAENIKRISAVSITPTGEVVEITGRNGQGKTSVLDSIWWALAGTGNVQVRPIRDGQEQARIFLDLGEIKVTRTFKASEKDPKGYTTTLTVENAEGVRASSPQAMLDSLMGSLSFDPLAFTKMKPKDQFDTLKQFVPGVDFDDIDRRNKSDFDKRTDINRQEKSIRAQVEGIRVPADVPAEAVDEAVLIAALDDAGRTNAEIEARRGRRQHAETEIERARAAAATCRSNAESLRKQAEGEDQKADEHEAAANALEQKIAEAPALPAQVDTTAIREKLARAGEINRAVEAKKRRDTLTAEADALKAESSALTKAIEDRNAAKAKAVADAEMPVDGLGFGDDIVTFNGVPFEQASDAEQLRASILIAAAMNPQVRVIRVRDGSLLDEDSFRELTAMAEAEGCQVWLETVQSGRPGAVVIEDGAVLKAGGRADA